MFDIVFLGTSASAPSIYRGLSAQAILAGEDRFLVDCGEGTQRQILRSGIGFKKMNRILLTHPHLDHILGLGGLVSTFTRWESMEDLHIWGGAYTLERVHTLLFDVVLLGQTPPIPIHLHTIDEAAELYTGKDFTVSAFPVTHRGRGCFGYTFKENDHRPFMAEKATALGVPHGPERSQLVKGETITLDDGTIITPDMVLGDTVKGTKVCITGDIGRTDNIHEFVANADVLITEATFLDSERQEANQFGHITAKQAGELAKDVNIKHLLLTHVSRRYREYDVIKEAEATFSNSIVVRDLDHFSIRRGQSLTRVDASHTSK
ncbi:MAG: ribonuclease Z [Phototrophicaceae bacterium]